MDLNLNKPLAFIDLETTGLKIATDRIVEISIVKVMPKGEVKTKTLRLNPTIPISEESINIHKITDEDVANEPTFSDVAKDLNQFLNGADLAGYNSNKFDIPLLVEEFLRADVDFELKGRKLIDVQNIFHKMEPRTLSAAYQFYCNKSLENAHSAEADTVATYEILKSQIERYNNVEYKDRNGDISTPIQNDVNALSQFSVMNKNADLVGHIIFNKKDEEVFNFGKYKGKTVDSVFQKEPAYYDWMMKSDFPLSTKKVITSIKLRAFNNR
ncbi:MAG: exonuclease domain-containing protein [Hyphomicrobiales bacterium]